MIGGFKLSVPADEAESTSNTTAVHEVKAWAVDKADQGREKGTLNQAWNV